MKHLAILIICAFSIQAFSQGKSLWGSLEAGNYAVGFSSQMLHDSSRTVTIADEGEIQKATPRPIQMFVWYPAIQSNSEKYLRFETYVELDKNLMKSTVNSSAVSFLDYPYLSKEIAKAALTTLLTEKVFATHDAKPSPGEFPVVILAQGNGDPLYRHSIMCEYLASHGYVVATTPGITRIPESSKVGPIDDQTRDLKFLMKHLRQFDFTMTENLSFIASSFGGGAVGHLLFENPQVKSIISLDSFLSRDVGIEMAKFKTSAKYASAVKVPTPFLNIYQEEPGMVKHDLSFLNTFSNSEIIHIKMNDMQHFNITSLGMIAGLYPEISAMEKLLVGGMPAVLNHEIMCIYVKAFLNAHVKGDAAAKVFVRKKPAENGLKNVSVEFQTTPQTG